MNRVLSYYGRVSAKVVESGDITGAQSVRTVTAGDDIFKPEHVGRTILFDTGESCVIEEYGNPTSVSVLPKQTVLVTTFRILPAAWHRLGRAYESEIDSAFMDFGVSGREKQMKSCGAMFGVGSNGFAADLRDTAYKTPITQATETSVILTVSAPFVTGEWIWLGRTGVSGVTASVSYLRYISDAIEPFNPGLYADGSATDVLLTKDTHYEVDEANGRVRLLSASPLTLAVASGMITFAFSCAAVGSSFAVELWGGLTPGSGVSQLFSRALPQPHKHCHVKTHYRKYLYQDRIKVAGAHGPVRMEMRSFEIHGIESSQIGRQSRA